MKHKRIRKKGNYYPRIAEKYDLEYLRKNCCLPERSWDDWKDQRDGIRYNPDMTHIRSPFMNKQQKEQIIMQNKKIKEIESRRKISKRKKETKTIIKKNNTLLYNTVKKINVL